MRILVCGGAGYIGSHASLYAVQQGHSVVVLDNLSTGHADSVAWTPLSILDIGNQREILNHLRRHRYDLIMHFCASSLVAESVQDPAKYYLNNVSGTLSLLRAMVETGHQALVFSSSAAVYGSPLLDIVDESQPALPINPYGRSKLMIEQVLQDYHSAYGLDSVSLRYFNAAGAEAEGRIGELHEPETHLIPNVLKSARDGAARGLKVFGDSYPTADGTCVRDYVHVSDLASAHLLAGRYLAANPGAHCFNLGSGRGYSVLEIIRAAEQVTGSRIPFTLAAPRQGDPASLVADIGKARRELHWEPQVTRVEALIASAWNWHRHERFAARVFAGEANTVPFVP